MQLIRLVDKTQIRTDAIFEGNLTTSRSDATLKGYNATWPEFKKCMEAEAFATDHCGPIHVDLERPAVGQLQEQVHRIINAANDLMKPFLELFGVDEHNGIFPLLSQPINSPADMKALTEEFFRPPPKDKRDYPSTGSDVTSDDGDNTTGAVEDADAIDGVETSDDITATVTKLVSNFVSEAQQEEDEKKESAVEHFYDSGADIKSGDKVYAGLKKMCQSTSISEMSESAMNIMQLLELGRLEGDKGSTSFDTKVKSFQQHWFRAKGAEFKNDEKKQTLVQEDAGSIYIERDSLISLTCERGKVSSVEYYRVLALFTKHYKKWYPSCDPQRFLWGKDSKDVRCLIRMLKMKGSSWKEVELERDGDFGPSCVFRVCSINGILSVGGRLVGDGVLH